MDISNLTSKRISQFLEKGKRFDNRGLLDYREIKIETGISINAEGSARVRIGETEVVAGVKMSATEPYPDGPDEGVLITGIEHMPLSSPDFESGPPKIEAIEMARIIDRGIRESGFIDFKKLCIKEGEKVWLIFLDMYSINDAGNLADAAALAALAALKTARIPEYDAEKDQVKFGTFTDNKLPLTESMPITFTFYKIGKSIISDPNKLEEKTSETKISVAVSKRGEKIMINSCQKSGEKTISKEELFSVLDNAIETWKKLGSELSNKIGQ